MHLSGVFLHSCVDMFYYHLSCQLLISLQSEPRYFITLIHEITKPWGSMNYIIQCKFIKLIFCVLEKRSPVKLASCNDRHRYEYESDPQDNVRPTVSRVRIHTQSDFNVNVSVANANMLLEAYSSWMDLSKLEESNKKQELQVICMRRRLCYDLLSCAC